jgi:hypothetical protein
MVTSHANKTKCYLRINKLGDASIVHTPLSHLNQQQQQHITITTLQVPPLLTLHLSFRFFHAILVPLSLSM